MKTIFVVIQAARDYDEEPETIIAYEDRRDATKFIDEKARVAKEAGERFPDRYWIDEIKLFAPGEVLK